MAARRARPVAVCFLHPRTQIPPTSKFTGMHRCWQITEIQEHIIHYASVSTNCQLALTCHALYESAMDAIWATLRGYVPLIKCMPAEVWTETFHAGRHREIYTMGFTRNPTPEEWQAFRKHAWRVRCFDADVVTPLRGKLRLHVVRVVETETMNAISQNVCDVAAQGLGPTSLFPGLTRLRSVSYDELPPRYELNAAFRCVPFLAGTSLRGFELRAGNEGYDEDMRKSTELVDVDEVLPALAARCPGLTRIELDSSTHGASACLMQLTRLEDIVQVPIDVQTDEGRELLTHLATLSSPGLRTLTLMQQPDSGRIVRSSPLRLTKPAFSSLTYLALQDMAFNYILPILDTLSGSRQLRGLYLSPDTCVDDHAVMRIGPAVTRLTSLENVSISFWYPGTSVTVALTSSLLDNLHSLRSLRDVSMYGFSSTTITDTDLAALGSACPQLEVLLCSTLRIVRLPEAPRATLAGLSALRNACPRLSSLSLDVGSDLGPGVSRHTPQNIQLLQPLYVTIGHHSSPLRIKAQAAALIVYAMFPKIESFVGRGYWRAVEVHVRRLQSIAFEDNNPFNCPLRPGLTRAVLEEAS